MLTHLWTGPSRAPILHIIDNDDENAQHIRAVPAAAISSWGALLGYDDPDDVLDAIAYVSDHGEPEPDPDTGHNAWTDCYLAWADLLAAEARAKIAEETTDEVELRAPREDDIPALEEAVADAQDATRDTLGLPDPVALSARSGLRDARLDGLRRDLRGPYAEALAGLRADFLRTMTPHRMETRWTGPNPPALRSTRRS